MQSWFTLELNGSPWRLRGLAVNTSLLHALKQRGQMGALVRTDGDQGGVLVMMRDEDRQGRAVFRSIDAGRVPLLSLSGREVWTREGLQKAFPHHPLWALTEDYSYVETHPVRLDNLLMLLFEYSHLSEQQRGSCFADSFISRTADYVGVRKMFAEVSEWQGLSEVEGCGDLADLQYVDEQKNRFFRPSTIVDLFELKRQSQSAKVLAGGMDWQYGGQIELPMAEVFLSPEGIGELRVLTREESHWEIGAALSLTEILDTLGGEYPSLGKVLQHYSTGPVRNRATLGGQLSSDLGRTDLAPVLLALDARVRLVSEGGARDLTLDRFYGKEGERTLRANEIIKSVSLPRNTEQMFRVRDCDTRLCDSYKVAARRVACQSMITAAFAVELDEQRRVLRAVFAYGSLKKSRPLLAVKAAAALKGRVWDQQAVVAVLRDLDEEVALLAGLEAKDDRRVWVSTLLQKFCHQHPQGQKANAELDLDQLGDEGEDKMDQVFASE
ncbi:MAG: FAD binding domain-containing protein [Verrucomicrobiales bacterium]|nr:FAD binding domain-containing protein [Verrucomicrobiales bacterium]